MVYIYIYMVLVLVSSQSKDIFVKAGSFWIPTKMNLFWLWNLALSLSFFQKKTGWFFQAHVIQHIAFDENHFIKSIKLHIINQRYTKEICPLLYHPKRWFLSLSWFFVRVSEASLASARPSFSPTSMSNWRVSWLHQPVHQSYPPQG